MGLLSIKVTPQNRLGRFLLPVPPCPEIGFESFLLTVPPAISKNDVTVSKKTSIVSSINIVKVQIVL